MGGGYPAALVGACVIFGIARAGSQNKEREKRKVPFRLG